MKRLFILLLTLNLFVANAQIKDVKKSSKSNSSSSSSSISSSSSYSNSSSSASSDLSADLIADAFSCCFNNGFLLGIGLVAKNHKSIMNLMENDPTVLSFDVRANFALGWHYAKNKNYIYVNYLPGVRGNLGAFSTDFRFNILTEYTDNFPDSFTSWEWLFLFNIEPSTAFKLTLGTGVQSERYTDSYYNEHYLGFRFILPNNIDHIEANTRLSMDYGTGNFPFFEGGIHYKKRIAAFNVVYMYITLGGVYQNYYSAHDIWAAQGGLVVNIH